MVERQQGRPTEDEFIGAASRFVGDHYDDVPLIIDSGFGVHVRYVKGGRASDIDVIHREWRAEGLSGEIEDITEFAKRQLEAYSRLRKH